MDIRINKQITFPLIISAFLISSTSILAKSHNPISDIVITKKIVAKYTADPIIRSSKIKVSTHSGTVSLRGNVDSQLAYNGAIIAAIHTDGVCGINFGKLNFIKSAYPQKDINTNENILATLDQEGILPPETLSGNMVFIETSNGTVYMTGIVDSVTRKQQIIKTASAVSGVKNIKTSIEVG